MNFISISGTDCTCFSIDTSPPKHSFFSSKLILIALSVLEKTRSCSSLDQNLLVNVTSLPFFATQRSKNLSWISSRTRVAWVFRAKATASIESYREPIVVPICY